MSLPLGVAMTDVDTRVIRGIVVSLSMWSNDRQSNTSTATAVNL